MRNTERASSSGLTVLLPTDLSVSHASSKAVSKTTKVCGSKELLWKPRIAPPSDFSKASAQTWPSLRPWLDNRATERLTAFDGVSFAKKRARVRSQFFGQLITLDCV